MNDDDVGHAEGGWRNRKVALDWVTVGRQLSNIRGQVT